MQTLSTDLYPDPSDEHLRPVAATMILAALPQRIQRALLAHAQETQYPLEMVLEMVLEMAIAGFLDTEAITFSDCRPEEA